MVPTVAALSGPVRTGIATPASASNAFVGSPLSQAASVTLAWMAITVVAAAVLLIGAPKAMRGLRDDIVTEPDTTFAVGFVALFGLLVCSGLPLFVGTSLEHSGLIAVGLIVATPGLLACVALLLGGGCVGTVAVGDRLGDRLGSGAPSAWRALGIGLLALGGSQLVPIAGTIATIAVASVGSGAIVNYGTEAWRGEPLLGASTDARTDRRTAARSAAPSERDRSERRASSDPTDDDGDANSIPAVSGTRSSGEAGHCGDAAWGLENGETDLEAGNPAADEHRGTEEASRDGRGGERRNDAN
ncbi:hypothetical protein [Natrinema altunense]|uniref:DUF8173 domain-containing protein n=1 Tax=Natrinema altunense (strain JCM 12890 / CGMCC 1.3731 / AJ2) TaxID=1227494 RepID=L9ZZD6_NATA2|nr:hypothetical protein [Natrinema altunense]ELY90483.1 hypothetical protein C485_02863 [Natrinema altunense JCM 12890]